MPEFAQTRPSGTSKPRVAGVKASAVTEPEPVMAKIDNFGFVVSLNEQGMASVGIQVSETADSVNAKDLDRIYGYFSSLHISRRKTPSVPFDPVVIIKAASTLSFGKVAEFIEPLRRPGSNKIKIVFDGNDFIIVPAKISETKLTNFKPNPLTLVVQLENNGFIAINNEPHGSMGDLQKLSDKLKQIFQARRDSGVFRNGSNEIESTVTLKVSQMRLFSDVEKLADSIRKAGSDRIMLYIEAEEPVFIVERKPIIQ